METVLVPPSTPHSLDSGPLSRMLWNSTADSARTGESTTRSRRLVGISTSGYVGIRWNAFWASFLIVRLCLSVSVTSAHHPWTIRKGVGVPPCSRHGFESQGIGGDIYLFLMV